jgi:hypothetical protein
MATVFFPPLLREATGGVQQCDVTGNNLRQVIVAVEAQFPELVGRLRQGDSLAPGLSASIDSAFAASLFDDVRPESEIHFLPALGGG